MEALQLYKMAVSKERDFQYGDAREMYSKLVSEYSDTVYGELADSNLSGLDGYYENATDAERCTNYRDSCKSTLKSISTVLSILMLCTLAIYIFMFKGALIIMVLMYFCLLWAINLVSLRLVSNGSNRSVNISVGLSVVSLFIVPIGSITGIISLTSLLNSKWRALRNKV
ncbi:MAG: hypothetical protein COA42_09915 [Alteromonadaceae bacterium]|nr:MAG: hypothetical protein COA42_09915 [Alteromonadaceae bacterium]